MHWVLLSPYIDIAIDARDSEVTLNDESSNHCIKVVWYIILTARAVMTITMLAAATPDI